MDIKIKDKVYIKSDPDQLERVVTAITQRECGYIYEISFCTEVSSHYSFELSTEKDVLKSVQ